MIPKELQERIDSFVDNSEFSYSRQSMYEAARLALEYMGDRWVSVDEGVTRKQELIWYNPNIYLPEVSETSHISDGVLFRWHEGDSYNTQYTQIGNYCDGETLCKGFAYDFSDEDEIVSVECIIEWAYINPDSKPVLVSQPPKQQSDEK